MDKQTLFTIVDALCHRYEFIGEITIQENYDYDMQGSITVKSYWLFLSRNGHNGHGVVLSTGKCKSLNEVLMRVVQEFTRREVTSDERIEITKDCPY